MLRHTFDRMEQEILEVGRDGILAAHAFGCGAAVASDGPLGLFALVAEHGLILQVFVRCLGDWINIRQGLLLGVLAGNEGP
jgi:hypothetical protein